MPAIWIFLSLVVLILAEWPDHSQRLTLRIAKTPIEAIVGYIRYRLIITIFGNDLLKQNGFRSLKSFREPGAWIVWNTRYSPKQTLAEHTDTGKVFLSVIFLEIKQQKRQAQAEKESVAGLVER